MGRIESWEMSSCTPRAVWGFAASRSKRHAIALLGIGRRRWRVPIPAISLYRRKWKKVAEVPKTLEEHLKQKRVDAGLSIAQVAKLLGVAKRTVEYWESKRHAIVAQFRPRVIEFLGYNPMENAINSTRDSK